ncbi:4-alpha-glucanotransferase [Actinoplanes sp. SE50]|uniref:4-alpha-glucanotransferase n=1 Tax=unclassified Actinoplanes TaxID=2626549 RepID=UPI00006CA2D7|nr:MULTISPECIES: 4-alpha-glucanotransferase [unclassified Actinoplanes]AEV84569.1 acarbose 4-alpha-glucanotransferase [Actinoplanes sp. SE50/110]ATO82961.1 4-alpha-glucanotransferase [Actinoplanes sp. SE50]CAJ81029.1 putative acarbose 4-alpha-glucanotransferase AcbQ [Actinoplanes sp. SE50/110]SLM00369.1 acarbose 4-alpha-glucanotransferase, amlyomaltase [Actinoplanes sp. SE50/110]
MTTTTDAALIELAGRYGVSVDWTTDRGEPRTVPADTIQRILAVLGVDASSGPAIAAALRAADDDARHRLLPSCVVVRQGEPARGVHPVAGAAYVVATEDGGRHETADPRNDLGRLPIGYHTLRVRVGDRSAAAPVIVAPAVLGTPDRRHWGMLAQIYSVLSERSWGMGDLGDLADLTRWSARLGASFVLVNPMHAYVPDRLADPTPYRPGSRRFADPMYLRLADVAEYATAEPAVRAELDRAARQGHELTAEVLHRNALIDRARVWPVKRNALERLYRAPRTAGRSAALAAFTAREGRGLEDYATWCALAEVYGTRWRSWPAALQSPHGPAVAAARRELVDRIDFHRWLAWLVDEQMAAAQAAAVGSGMAIGVIHDLAVGVDPEGADAWAVQDHLAGGVTVGCPADDFNPLGQDWGLPPWRPDTLAEAGYRPFADVIRGTLRHSGALRLDHILGLFRLWWIPAGSGARDGAYVRYDHEAMLGVLAVEAFRAGAMIIGEDLGTVHPAVRAELADRGILGTSVLRFEYQGGSENRSGPLPADQWRAGCLATLTTHDLPSTAAWLSGEHVDLQDRLGLLNRPRAEVAADAAAERDGWLAELRRTGLLEHETAVPGMSAESLALHRFLARTPARLVGVWLPDLVGDRRPQNLPGTSTEFPNWQLPVADADGRPVAMDDLASSAGAQAVAGLYAASAEPATTP